MSHDQGFSALRDGAPGYGLGRANRAGVFLTIGWLAGWMLLAGWPRTGLSASMVPTGQGATSQICDVSARFAARQVGVPLDVLRAVSRVETGRRSDGVLKPWPWTVNMEGLGKWFPDRLSARAFAMESFKAGARSFDIGCFQINYKWHGQAFRSIDEMFDPNSNAIYAARFLKGLYAEYGDWSAAVGAYHSRTPNRASSYVARFEKVFAGLSRAPMPDAPGIAPNAVSLIAIPRRALIEIDRTTVAAGSVRTPGSLVPLRGRVAGALVFIVMNGAMNGAMNGNRN